MDLLIEPFIKCVDALLEHNIQNIESDHTLLMILNKIFNLNTLLYLMIFSGFLARQFCFSYLIQKIDLTFTKFPLSRPFITSHTIDLTRIPSASLWTFNDA